MPTGVFYSPGWDSWEEGLFGGYPNSSLDGWWWRLKVCGPTREGRSEAERIWGCKCKNHAHSSSRWNCSDIEAVEKVIMPYSFCTCSLNLLSTFSLITQPWSHHFLRGTFLDRMDSPPPTNLLIPSDEVRSQVYSVPVNYPRFSPGFWRFDTKMFLWTSVIISSKSKPEEPVLTQYLGSWRHWFMVRR